MISDSLKGHSDGLRELLEYVKSQRAVDFAAYRPNTIRRRLDLRLSATGMHDYASYVRYIEENPGELDSLIDSLTIKVSHFFRNPLVFEVLKEIVLPGLIENFKDDILRIWCAGCARGEEPYSVAILLKEVMSSEHTASKVFIIGTDIDLGALEYARRGVYEAESLQEVKKAYIDRYFAPEGGLFRVSDEIRGMVTFAYHDIATAVLPKEGIFSDYHLIFCRNVLIYFSRGLYERVLAGITDSLLARGYLVLGEAESLPPHLSNIYDYGFPIVKVFRKR